MLRQTQQFSVGISINASILAALGDQRVVCGRVMRNGNQNSSALCAIQPASKYQAVAEPCRASIIDLGADHNGIRFLCAISTIASQAPRKVCARYLNEAQIRNMDTTPPQSYRKTSPARCANTGAMANFKFPI